MTFSLEFSQELWKTKTTPRSLCFVLWALIWQDLSSIFRIKFLPPHLPNSIAMYLCRYLPRMYHSNQPGRRNLRNCKSWRSALVRIPRSLNHEICRRRNASQTVTIYVITKENLPDKEQVANAFSIPWHLGAYIYHLTKQKGKGGEMLEREKNPKWSNLVKSEKRPFSKKGQNEGLSSLLGRGGSLFCPG